VFALLLRRSTDGRRSFYRAGIKNLTERFSRTVCRRLELNGADLTDADAMGAMGRTIRESDDMFVILVDRNTNFADDDLDDAVRHETCHIATWWKEQDMHGPVFQACMARIKQADHNHN